MKNHKNSIKTVKTGLKFTVWSPFGGLDPLLTPLFTPLLGVFLGPLFWGQKSGTIPTAAQPLNTPPKGGVLGGSAPKNNENLIIL